MKVISTHLNVPFADLVEDFVEFKDEAMERLLIQMENADPAFAAELGEIYEKSECETILPPETDA